jgi:lipopolysaccharide biosynthesis glycosyltransferase
MKWYMGLNESSIHEFGVLILAAVESARRFTDLQPHLLYGGKENEFTRKASAVGIQVIFHEVSFIEALRTCQAKHAPHWSEYVSTARGAFQRLDIPTVETEEEFVLYTDCDVHFRGPVSFETMRPEVFAAGPQFNLYGNRHNELNSGVMVINVPRLRRDLPMILELGTEIVGDFQLTYDQEFLLEFYRGRWDPMALKYNWKPYWGENNDARLVHWHGPKPETVRAFLRNEHANISHPHFSIFSGNQESYRSFLAEWDAWNPPGEIHDGLD